MKPAKLSKNIKTIGDILIKDNVRTLIRILQNENPDLAIIIFTDKAGKVQVSSSINDAATIIHALKVAEFKLLSEIVDTEEA